MRRGTTPTLTFTLPFSTEGMDVLNLAFSQKDSRGHNILVLQKTLKDVTLDVYTVTTTLTEEETLKLSEKLGLLEIQIRCGFGDAKLTSNIIEVEVERILKDGVI